MLFMMKMVHELFIHESGGLRGLFYEPITRIFLIDNALIE